MVGAEPGGGVVHREPEHRARVEAADREIARRSPASSRGSTRPARSASRSRGRRRPRPRRRARAARRGRARGRRPSRSSRRSPARGRRGTRRGTRSRGPTSAARRSTSMPPSSLAELLGAVAVPSGLPSSMTSTSASGSAAAGASQHVVDVLDLVVRRQHHEDAHRGRAYRPRRLRLLHGHTIGRWPTVLNRLRGSDADADASADRRRRAADAPVAYGIPPRVLRRRRRRVLRRDHRLRHRRRGLATPTRRTLWARWSAPSSAPAGVGIVAVLVLRAMAEWRRQGPPDRMQPTTRPDASAARRRRRASARAKVRRRNVSA